MDCPTCGLYLARPVDRCPHCGQPFARPGSAPSAGRYGPPEGPGGYGPPPGYAQAPPYGYSNQPDGWSYGSPNSGYGPPASPSRPLFGQESYGYDEYGQRAASSPPLTSSAWADTGRRPRSCLGVASGVIASLVVGVVVMVVMPLIHGNSARPSDPNVIYSNSLTTANRDWNWSTSGPCNFASDGYHITDGWMCFTPKLTLSDATYTVNVKMLAGSTTAANFGIVVRRVGEGNAYLFGINGNGAWSFSKSTLDQFIFIVKPTPNTAIKRGLNTTNTLQVVAKGSYFTLFVNGTKVGQAHDSTYAIGNCGLYAGSKTEAVFTDFKVTKK